MAGKTPLQAVDNFVKPLQRALSCVTNSVLIPQRPNPSQELYALLLGKGKPIWLPTDDASIGLTMILGYRVVEATGALGPWKVTTATYYYQLLNDNEKEILSYHWHPKEPNTYSLPHLHLGSGSTVTHGGLRKAHLPTGRVAVEDILLLAILHLGVAPRRTDWEEVLNETKAKFEQYKTWG